jgi:hypothetical protein
MKKLSLVILIVLAIVVIGLTAGLSYAWFVSVEKMNSNILHQANSPVANIIVEDIQQDGTLAPAVPYVDSDGIPSYTSDPTGYAAYIAANGLLVADGVFLAKGAETVEITGRFKYEGKDDQGGDTGARTIVVQFLANETVSGAPVHLYHFCFQFEADDDENPLTPPDIECDDDDRQTYGELEVNDSFEIHPYANRWYYFTLSIYFSDIDDEMNPYLNGLAMDFTLNIIAPEVI